MRTLTLVAFTVLLLFQALTASALDEDHRARGEAVLARSIAYLRTQQAEDGSWLAEAGPAVTGLVVAGFLDTPGITLEDPAVKKGVDYILEHQQDDGGIYDQILANYNTSVCLMALGRAADDPRVPPVVKQAQDFLRNLQWSNGKTDDQGDTIDGGHPWSGGAGYGKHGRPDLSNTAMMIAGLNDSGLECEDPAYQRAMNFISMLQGSPANPKFAARIEPGGGFIYATSTNKDNIGVPQSQAGEIVHPITGRSTLRTYGSMTYAGFMSYLYAQLDRDDPRVADAFGWIAANYTLDENPGIGEQGYFYYLHVFARALHAWGDPTIVTPDGATRTWPHDLIAKLESLQREDGSFVNPADRWLEAEPQLCTAYAVMALQRALQ
ncbi:MAG: prenyltransferase/squalene oxidase repeat-containing protein [Planctomycetota bacterium]|jgi:squalene-hopene/tetraprenyl-beta-curcumene cyclase